MCLDFVLGHFWSKFRNIYPYLLSTYLRSHIFKSLIHLEFPFDVRSKKYPKKVRFWFYVCACVMASQFCQHPLRKNLFLPESCGDSRVTEAAVSAVTWGSLPAPRGHPAALDIPDQDCSMTKGGSRKLNTILVSETTHSDLVLGWPGRYAPARGHS